MISSVYNYYLSQYAHRTNARYDSHKKDELKNTYSKMMKINRQTPFYKVDVSEAAQRYAIDLKENAREFTNIANDISENEAGLLSFKKTAESSDSDSVEVEFTGDSNCPPSNAFSINVSQLAQSQINTGNYLQPNSKHIKAGDYKFDLKISDLTYEFEFNVKSSESTSDVQQKLSRLINRANIGLSSSVLTDSLGNTALSIESENTGIISNKPTIFEVSNSGSGLEAQTTECSESATTSSENINEVDVSDSTQAASENTTSTHSDNFDASDVVTMLGLNRVTQYPANAIFSVDGNERVSTTNYFTVNNAFDIDLKKTTDGNPVTISLNDDNDDIINSIEELVGSYNQLVNVTNQDANNVFSGNAKLKNTFLNLAHSNHSKLESSGLSLSDDGTLKVDQDTVRDIASNGNLVDALKNIKDFKTSVQEKAEMVYLNPMDYVNNTIIAYRNPIKGYSNPYLTSLYSGMMFNGYI